MKLISAFLRLIRWPNLLFIVLTQWLFVYAIIGSKTDLGMPSHFHPNIFCLLVIATVFIAAAGYIINDYFDLNIDSINKPAKLVIDKLIKRRWAIMWHVMLSVAGVAISFYIDYKAGTYWLGLTNLVCVFLLFGYSITLKKKLLSGNMLISLLTAWVILVVFFQYPAFIQFQDAHENLIRSTYHSSLTRISFLYAGFTFVISLIREVLKDMEDREGDEKYGCHTMPIQWGIPASKVFVAVWIIVLIAVLVIVQFYVLPFGWWWSALYCLLLIILPLVLVLKKLYQASIAADYHRLSVYVKMIMLTGILSMLFFKIYS